ncbi:MAG: 3-dehydroquinate synthase [Clostridia bacterium]|nr:3-dehydroquinate synthase [Clostridia bacterium]
MKKLHLDLSERGYDIYVGRGLLSECKKYFNLSRKVFIVTDSGVPSEYAQTVRSMCDDATVVTVPMGEGSKSPETYTYLLEKMIEFGMTRSDCAVAVGGGVVGDLTGFAAASYMRGIDFYNIPTTVLSQVDSSIGGKVAINLGGIKNIVGAFHQPKGVIIDPDTLKTLPKRQIANGLCEALKMSLTSDGELFGLFEREEINEDNIEDVIVRSLMIKKAVVEADEREGGLRRILNFGHTFGHAVEAAEELRGYYHGECVAIGMLVTSSESVKARLIPVLKRLGLPYSYEGDVKGALGFISHDKKCEGGKVSVVFVDEPGSFRIEKMNTEDFIAHIEKAFS